MNEEIAYRAVAAGWIEIRLDGSIWRIAQRRRNRWNNMETVKPVMPHRIDASVGVGYRAVSITIDTGQIRALAHRLVYRHFNGPIPPGLTINHRNGRKEDNRPENLELATYAEQVRHARDVLKVGRLDQNGTKNAMAKLTDEAVMEIRRRRGAGEKLSVIAADFGITDKTVSKIARGDSWAFLI